MKTKNGKQFEILVNAVALAGGEWEMIAPYGDFPTADRKRTQRFGIKQAEEMVATFNSIWHKVGSLFRGVPIFHGHPDVDPKNWPDDRRLGKIIALEARDDGLYGRPEYNSLGEENKAEGWWVYPSPTWLSPRTDSNVVLPDELMSVGLVNRPNIFESQPWTNAAETQDDETQDTREETEPNTDTVMKEKACALLGLDPAKATDEEISNGLDNLKKQADANAAESTKGEAGDNTGGGVRSHIERLRGGGMTLAEIGAKVDRSESTLTSIISGEIKNPPSELLQALKAIETPEKKEDDAEKKEAAANAKILLFEAERDTLNKELANARKAAATVCVESAIARGAITEAEREVTFNAFVADGADLEKLSKELVAKKPEMNTGALDLGDRKISISNARERSAAVQAEVAKRMDANGGNYDAAYKAVKKDPKFAQLFEAMQTPGK